MSTPNPAPKPRAAVRHLNYRGDIRAAVDGSTPLGPNTTGEHLWPVSAEYDAETDRTRVGLSYVAPGQP